MLKETALPEAAYTREALAFLHDRVPPELQQGLEILLSQAADAPGAMRRLERFCQEHSGWFTNLAKTPFGLQSLVTIFSHSGFLSEEMLQHPARLAESLTSQLHRVRSPDEMKEQLESYLGGGSDVPQALQLAQFRRAQLLRILLRDVLGFGALPEITEELSNLADAILDVTCRRLRAGLAARFGVPRLAGGNECEFSIVGLGKLGGRELNYSSDIDLMFIYGGPGYTDSVEPLTNQEFFKKVANQLTELLSTHSSKGFCYRVDLRLRPDGRYGEVCISLDGAQGYYTQRARDWELQMLIKARVCAGDAGPGKAFLKWVQPMIYSTTLDFSAIEDMSETRVRLNERMAQRRRAGGIDVKLTRGGIRDIEFLVQCLQRVHGGNRAWLQNSSTLLALARLRDKDLLSDSEYSRLASAYQFLRHLEHRLQYDEDRQTHLLPEDPEGLSLVARRMPSGLMGESATPENLRRLLNAHFEHVQEVYERVIHAQQPFYYTMPPESSPSTASGATEATGAEIVPTNLIRYLDQIAPQLAAVVSHARLGRSQFAFEHFLERILKQPGWLKMLDDDSVLAGYLIDLFEHSPFLAEQMVRSHELFEELIAIRREGIRDFSFEEAMPWADTSSEMRRFFGKEMFRLQAESICLQIPIFDTLKRCSALADAAVRGCFRLAVSQVASQHPPKSPGYTPWRQMMVVALGRLGMQEFDLGSDADLVFIIPDEDTVESHFWTRVAERMIELLGSYTGEGTCFSVDTRLRPNGRSGALVQSEKAYREYFQNHAEAWEGITYMKSRAVAGDVQRGTRFLEEIQRLDWRRYGQSGRSKKQLREMRLRLEKEHAAANTLKAGPGGYYDIDFALMYLRLKGAGMFFQVLNTPARIEIIEQMGHIDPADANFIRDGAVFYRAVDHGLRLMSGHTEGNLPESESQLKMLTELVCRWTPAHLHDQPLPMELKQIQVRTRDYFDRLFDAG
ncbi:MAG: glutamine-synthetase adenylyltransferase [Bryobacterales bacterium]|nr:glutamine-synthetase adenylyltransferase [Bryobacterales bacterium]